MRIQGDSNNVNLNNIKYGSEETNAKKTGNASSEDDGLIVKAGKLNLGTETIEEKLDEARAERKAKEEQLEEMCELKSVLEEVSSIKQSENMPNVKKSLENIVAELKLTMQDLSGAVVDDIV